MTTTNSNALPTYEIKTADGRVLSSVTGGGFAGMMQAARELAAAFGPVRLYFKGRCIRTVRP